MSVELREFSVHKNILLSVMQAQAGSLSKALMEGVMNSIDAQASRCSITLDEAGFVIKDNGTGFKSRDAIENYFETFGTPHEEGDSVLGTFRIGRGQIMSFASTKWRTGKFQMDVDIETGSIGYILTEHKSSVVGCTITGTLYKPLTEVELSETIHSLKDLVRYAPINVYLNGKLISRSTSSVKWDYEDDNGYYKLNVNEQELAVFNLGLLVMKLPASQFGTGGVVVSKKQLKVNFARNDILRNKCEIWRGIRAAVEAISLVAVLQKNSLAESERRYLCNQWSYNRVPEQLKPHLKNVKLFTLVSGKHISYNQLLESGAHRPISAAQGSKSQLATKINREGLALVLSDLTLSRFYCETLADLRHLLLKLTPSASELTFKPLTELAGDLKDAFVILDDEQIAPKALAMLKALRLVHTEFMDWFLTSESSCSGSRLLKAGSSDTVLAWTNGSTEIVITEKELVKAANQGEAGCFNLLLTLTHEYCHDEADLETHEHDIVFMSKHHDLIQYQGAALMQLAHRTYTVFQGLSPDAPDSIRLRNPVSLKKSTKAVRPAKARTSDANVLQYTLSL